MIMLKNRSLGPKIKFEDTKGVIKSCNSEDMIQWPKGKEQKRQKMIGITLHRKLKIGQDEPH